MRGYERVFSSRWSQGAGECVCAFSWSWLSVQRKAVRVPGIWAKLGLFQPKLPDETSITLLLYINNSTLLLRAPPSNTVPIAIMSAPSLAGYIMKRPWLKRWMMPLAKWYANAAGYRQLGLR